MFWSVITVNIKKCNSNHNKLNSKYVHGKVFPVKQTSIVHLHHKRLYQKNVILFSLV